MPSPVYLTPEAIAAILDLPKRDSIYKWIADGELKAISVASGKSRRPTWRISQAEFERFLASREATPVPAPQPRRTARAKRESVTQYF